MPAASTVPLALQTVEAYFNAVSVQNPQYALGVYLGQPVETAADNYLMIGTDAGDLISGYRSSWKTMPAPGQVDENYSVAAQLRVWSGEVAAYDRLTDAFFLFSAIRQQIWEDPGANRVQQGALTSSGSWGDVTLTMEFNGPTAKGGYGVILGFEIAVINVRINA